MKVYPIEAVLLGDQRDKMYIVSGKPMYRESGWISDSGSLSETKGEREAMEIEMVVGTEYSVFDLGKMTRGFFKYWLEAQLV